MIRESDSTALVHLIEDAEIKALGVLGGGNAEGPGLEWHHLPI